MPASGRVEPPTGPLVPVPASLAPAKNPTLDGMRGLAILLVVLSHLWVVHPFDDLDQIAPFDGWFKGGSLGVSIFLVLSGFLVTRSMLNAFQRTGPRGPAFTVLRRLVRISAQVYLLLVSVVVVARVDSTDVASTASTEGSVRSIATYTWNWWVREHALDARSDLGHLWYLSVELHVFVCAAVAIALWGRRRRALVVATVLLIAAVTWWRWHVHDVEGWYSASLRTTTRADAALYGILTGLVWDRVQRWRGAAAASLAASSVLIVAVVFSGSWLGIDAYFKAQGIVIAAATSVFVLAAAMDPSRTGVAARVLSSAPLRVLGEVSLPLYVWHLPLFWFVSRHTTTWGNVPRTVVAGLTLWGLVFVLHRYVDTPLRGWTDRIRPRRVARTAGAGTDDAARSAGGP